MGKMSARRHRPVSVERDACLILLGFDPPHPIEWQHDPPLGIRPYRDEDGRRVYMPDENDPRHIRPMRPADHKEETYGPKARASAVGTDRHTIDRTKRIETEQAAFRQRLLAKSKGKPKPRSKWASRPFQRARPRPQETP